MADTTIHIIGDAAYKVKLENESARLRFVEAYLKRVEDEKETDAFKVQRVNAPALLIPVKVLRERTYLETS